MPIEERLLTLSDVVIKHFIFLERSEVQHQLLAIALSLVVGWLLSKSLWRFLQKTFPQATAFIWSDARLLPRQYIAALIQHLDFPLISLLVLNLIRYLFSVQDWTRGLLTFAIQLMWVYFAYRFFLVSLYAAFPLATVRQYRIRLFAPLLILFFLGAIINLNNDLGQLSQISPFKLFNSPITLGAIFILIAGLYFWVSLITLLEDLTLKIFWTRNQLELGAAQATLLLIRYFLIALGIVLILGYIGVNGTAVAAITGGLSVGIGFGLQQVVSNFVSGILLLFEGVLRPGDIISVEGKICEVKRLGIRATTVRMLTDNSEKIIPNQTFFIKDVTTFTGSDRLVYCSLTVRVSADYNAQQVIDILLQIAGNHSKILQAPAPLVYLINVENSNLNFELKFCLNDINFRKRVISDLSYIILERFTKRSIELPFSQKDIQIRSG